MTLPTRALVLALGLSLAAPSSEAAVKLDAVVQARLGVATRPLEAARRSAAVSGFARAVDASPLAVLDADIAAAAAAAAASQAEAVRTRGLAAADATVARRTAELADSQARSDAAKLSMLRRRLGLEWGPVFVAMGDARRARLIASLAAGRATLVRFDVAGSATPPAGTVSIDLGPAGAASARILGPARVGDPRLQSAGLWAILAGPQAMAFGVGASAPARMTGGAEAAGVVIPREALLRAGGETWAYVRLDAARFERRPVRGGVPEPGGLFVTQGFRAGEPVVVKGAVQLFAAESPPKAAE